MGYINEAIAWRAGAAWFESQLLDYDVYSNQGNWLYIAGRGTDPRGGGRFNIEKQQRDHDENGAFRSRWLAILKWNTHSLCDQGQNCGIYVWRLSLFERTMV